MRKLLISRHTAKFVQDLEAKRYKQVVSKMLDLARDATPPDSEHMKGYDGRRTDIGEYRIVYSFDADTVYIDAVGKRNDDEVYKQVKR